MKLRALLLDSRRECGGMPVGGVGLRRSLAPRAHVRLTGRIK